MHSYPLELTSAYQHYLWGGKKISQHFHREITDPITAESWELSDRKEGMSVIANGEYANQTFHDLLQKFPVEIMGKEFEKFPLLIKLIDASKNLSIQVHPDDQDAKKMHAEAKTESWVVLGTQKDAFVLAGFNEKMDPERCMHAIKEKSLENYLQKIEVQVGDVISVPAGLIHAIGKGCLIFEVQQNSNTTYRVYDYGRKDKDGNERQLHVQEAMQTIHFDKGPGYVQKQEVLVDTKELKSYRLLHTKYFQLEKLAVLNEVQCKAKEKSFTYFFVMKGEGKCFCGGVEYDFNFGKSYLMPAALKNWTLKPQGDFELLMVTL